MDFKQLDIFDCFGNQYKIDKPIRLIELFAGIGSQAMALRDIEANFEHYKVVEWDKYAIASYNAIHGTDFQTMDITKLKGKDLQIVDKLKYCYIMTYSFPCTDLSVAGRMLGMAEGSGTRSSLLWEVKRLLDECEELPQILLMENVPQVHSKSNMPHFQKWLDYLKSRGYSTFWKDMNAKNYGVAQSRNRTIAVSILGDYTYTFPEEYPLNKVMKDYLEPVVDERYYVNSQKAAELIDKLIKGGKLDEDFEKYKNYKGIYKPFNNAISYPLHSQDFVRTGFQEISPTLSARDYKDPKSVIEMDKLECLGNIYNDNWNTGLPGNVWNANKPSPTLTTMQGGADNQ